MRCIPLYCIYCNHKSKKHNQLHNMQALTVDKNQAKKKKNILQPSMQEESVTITVGSAQ